MVAVVEHEPSVLGTGWEGHFSLSLAFDCVEDNESLRSERLRVIKA